jgi:2',3'-cyclic-nucleotide 2'-phosphodiesterase (5'-nucleotidase family)
MKKLIIFTITLAFTFLAGCSFLTTETLTTENSTNLTDTFISSSSSTDNPTTSDVITDFTTDIFTTLAPTTQAPTTQVPTTETPTTTETFDRYQDLYFLSINDFHGGAYAGIDSFSYIAGEVKYMKENYDNVFALANGDIFQGTAISNYYYGRPLVEAMNEASFDGFVIGNHEFDWGIDKIADYKDASLENGEMNYPILAANIVYEDTQTPLEFTTPYIIKETSGVRVGVIGLIGELMGSIAASRVENIEFLDPIDVIKEYTSYLRTIEDIDVIVVYIHDWSEYLEYEIASLSGDYLVDAVFFGHFHKNEASAIYDNRDNLPLVYARTNAYQNSLLAKIKLTYDLVEDKLVNFSVDTLGVSSLTYSSVVEMLFSEYLSNPDFQVYVNEVLATSQYEFDKYDLAPWGASVIRDYLGIDVGAVNTGGFRVNMTQGEVTMGDMVVIYPFDNVIKTSRLTGEQLRDFYININNGYNDVIFDDGLSYDGTTLYIKGSPIILDEYYTVGAVDYIFDKTDYDFIQGIDISYTGYFMRDLLVQDLKNNTNIFNPVNGTSYQVPLSIFFSQITESVI